MNELITKIKVPAHTGYAQLTLLKPHNPPKVDGYGLLIEGICSLASRDLLGDDYDEKTDAMDFFRSRWFEWLTNLDGEMIIQKLLATGRSL